MRAFHLAWLAFFVCFFGWFGLAPLMPVIRQELHLTKAQVGNLAIASVVMTIFVRMFIGWVCDHLGPRRTYTWLLILSSLPVMGVGLAHSYTTFLLFRLAIGAIGASFVITQYHTSVMFAPNVVGTANAAAAGWGNLGGGVTQMVMPLLFAGFSSLAGAQWGWRLAMTVPGIAMFLLGIAYYMLTQDTPAGDFKYLGKRPGRDATYSTFAGACRDPRVWALSIIYGACFGMELTIDNIAAMYLFARALGGIVSDRCQRLWGLRGRTLLLGSTLFAEGLALMLFSRMHVLSLAIAAMLLAGLFIKMSNGATYSVVPFINQRALGAVAGVVGAGGNLGAFLAGFFFKGSMPWTQALFLLGIIISFVSFLALTIHFPQADESQASLKQFATAGVSD